MKSTLIYLILLIFISCKSSSIYRSIIGNYNAEGKDYQYTLSIMPDSSFTLTQKYFEVNSTCRGKWNYLSNSSLLLKCEEEDLTATLQSGYMVNRERIITVKPNNKLKLGKIVLRKKN